MPARYYAKMIHHSNFAVEYFVLDSNAHDAHDPWDGPQSSNICSAHNDDGPGTCSNNGGMESIQACKQWFWDSYKEQRQWIQQKLAASTARWKVIVTHFPCGFLTDWYKELKRKYGLDLMLT